MTENAPIDLEGLPMNRLYELFYSEVKSKNMVEQKISYLNQLHSQIDLKISKLQSEIDSRQSEDSSLRETLKPVEKRKTEHKKKRN